jgi:hypothetical protein
VVFRKQASGRSLAAVLAVMAVVPVAWTLIAALRAGVVVGPDSLGYFQMAADLRQTGALPTRHWPLGYPLLLATLQTAGVERIAAATAINLAAFVLVAGLTLAWLARVAGKQAGWMLAGALTILASSTVLDVFRHALSEPAFLVAVSGVVWTMSVYFQTGRLRWLAGAAVWAGASVWLRYAGLFLAPAIALAPLLFGSGSLRRRWGWTWVALAAFALPVAGLKWALSALAPEPGAVRALAWHPLTLRHLDLWGQTAASWLAPTAWVAESVWLQRAGIFLSVWVPVGVWAGWRRRNAAAAWLALLALTYLAGILLTVLVADHNAPLDARLLMPFYVSLAGCLIAAGSSLPGRPARLAALVAFIAMGLWCGFRGLRYLNAAPRDAGFNAAAWRTDPLHEWIRGLPDDWLLASNAAGALRFHAGRAVQSYPRAWDSVAARTVDELGPLAVLAEAASSGNVVLVYYPGFSDSRDEPLERVLGELKLEKSGEIGRAWVYSRNPLFFDKMVADVVR